MTDELSYLMGIFDGEGTICPSFRRDGYINLHVAVHMAAPDVVAMFSARWGGRTSKRKPYKLGHLVLDTWCITGTRTIPFLEYGSQHLIVKQKQAELALLLAKQMLLFTNANRIGKSCGRGLRLISDDQLSARRELACQIRSLNGARSRFVDFARRAS